jgi:hypothetical protein
MSARRPPRGARRWAPALAALLLWPGAGGAVPDPAAADRAFDPASEGWDGLAYLRETAAQAEVALEIADALDWGALRGDESLVVIAPHAELDGHGQRQLAAFIAAGGRLVLADDFRAGASWAQAFGVRRVPELGQAPEALDGLAAFPSFAGAALGRFLGYRVDAVALNHPSGWVVEPLPEGRAAAPRPSRAALGRAVDGVRAWLIEVRLGRGRALLLSDSSALINAMVRGWHGNKQFAANLLRWGCYADQPCTVRLLSNLAATRGAFVARQPGAGAAGRASLRELADQGLRWLAELLRQRGMAPAGWLLALLGLTAPALLAARLPAARLPRRAPTRPRQARLRATVEAWLRQPDADYQRPARQLGAHLGRTLWQAAHGGDAGGADAAAPAAPEAAIAALVERGRLSPEAGLRLREAALALERARLAEERVDRARFAALAAEVEWAEQVLRHTRRRAP